jgi:nucleoside-diphosphate-sugar epimerase
MRIKDARQTFLGVWIRNVMAAEDILIYGDGKQIRDFNYVDDVVDALILAATNDAAIGQIFNLGAKPPVDLKTLADLMLKINGKGNCRIIPFPAENRAIDIGDYYADYTLISKTLGWTPKISLEEGLKRSVDFYREFGAHYK